MGVTTNLAASGFRYQYVPTLKTRSGEVTALGNLQAPDRIRTVPVFQIVSDPPTTFCQMLGSVWSGLYIGLDGVHESQSSGNVTAFANMHSALIAAGINVIPLLDFNSPPNYTSAIVSLQSSNPSLIYRMPVSHLQPALSWATANGIVQSTTDLIVDCGHVADIDPLILIPACSLAVSHAIPLLSGWRSVTISASAAPINASGMILGANLFPRRDWQLWLGMSSAYPFLNFGDYGIAHRDFSEVEGYMMANATVSPRYTLDSDWLWLKGRSTRGPSGVSMANQYHAHAQTLVGYPNFNGIAGCWGDQRIAQIAAQATSAGSGSRATWVGLSLNRHLALVTNRLP